MKVISNQGYPKQAYIFAICEDRIAEEVANVVKAYCQKEAQIQIEGVEKYKGSVDIENRIGMWVYDEELF